MELFIERCFFFFFFFFFLRWSPSKTSTKMKSENLVVSSAFQKSLSTVTPSLVYFHLFSSPFPLSLSFSPLSFPPPGPGLGVRILCTNAPYVPENLSTIEDNIRSLLAPFPALSEFSFVVLPVRSVGVQGDNRSYNSSVCLIPPSAPSKLSAEAWEALWKVAEALPNHVK